MGYVIGLDIGTGSCRAIAVDEEGRVVASAVEQCATLIPRQGWEEQDPQQIYQAAIQAIRRLVSSEPLAGLGASSIAGLAIDGVMHSLIAMGPDGELATRALTWGDLRSTEDAEILARDHAGNFYAKTGCPIHPMYLPAKLRWLHRRLGAARMARCRFLSLKEYVLYRLTGRLTVDWSIASATGLMNTHTLQWDEEILGHLGVRPDQLSDPCSPRTVIEGLTEEAASETGLPASTPVVVGAADGPVSNLGTGVLDQRRMALVIGTSSAVRTTATEPLLDPQRRTWCYHLGDQRWVPGGATNNGGNVFRWLGDHVFSPLTYDELNAAAASVPAGSEGLLFLAFLAGERCPGWNPHARGAMLGLTLSHTRGHMVRAALEGTVFQLYGVYEALIGLTGVPREIIASGGFTRSPLWLQIAADVFGTEFILPECEEGSALGVAALGHVALGQWPDLAAVEGLVRVKQRIVPDQRAHALYMELYDLYRGFYETLSGRFGEIARFQSTLAEPAASEDLAREEGA